MLGINAKGLHFGKRKPGKFIIITIAVTMLLTVTTGVVVYNKYKYVRKDVEYVNIAANKPENTNSDNTKAGQDSGEANTDKFQDNPLVGEAADNTNEITPEETDKPAEVSDYEVRFEDIFKKDGVKTAFLTFDDGPTKKITPQVMEVLNKYSIKASFFVMGEMADKYPELLKQQYEEGHSICIHSYYHDYDSMYNSTDFFKKDLEKSITSLKSILGQDFNTRIYRFPGGSSGKNRDPYKEILKEDGFVYIDWNALNGDSESLKENGKRRQRTAPELVDRLKESIDHFGKPEDIVILMHDAAAKQATVDALPEIIEHLASQGYSFKTMK